MKLNRTTAGKQNFAERPVHKRFIALFLLAQRSLPMTANQPQDIKPKRFRIAFSFAGEKRDFMEKTARLLAQRFGEDKILYDKFHEAEFARNDLSVYLPNFYNRESDLVVVIVCPHYDIKEWTGLEWLAIHDLLRQRRREEVMLCRFNYAQVEGLFGGAGFIELDQKTPEQFVALIVERLALNEGLPKGHYVTPGTTVNKPLYTSIPHNLPTLQPFFGREDELKKIAEALDPENRTWGALIDGPGGMGKTSLAVRAAYDAPAGAFDRIIFISLKSRELDDSGERDLSGFLIGGLVELLNELARLLDRDNIVKTVETERPRLLLDALRRTKTLLILDNLESLTKSERDTVFTFVKRLPQGCKAILTSRGRIGSGAEELILGKLSPEAALETLAELAIHNPELAKTSDAERLELYRETGGKPLLLRWTAGQIGRGHCVTLKDAMDYLRSCPKENDPLEFIFGDLIEDFSEAETNALCALSWFTLPATVKHIATIAEKDEAEVIKALKSLINRSLVVPSEELQTFTLVPLVADFLRVKKPEVLNETGNRLEKYVYALVIENGYYKHDHFQIIDANWALVAAALSGFLAGVNEQLQDICDALFQPCNYNGRYDESLVLNNDAENCAIAAGDYNNAGWRAYNAGWIYVLRGQSKEVLDCANRAEAHWLKEKTGIREQAIAISLRGNGYELAKDYIAAITSFQQAVEFNKSLNSESNDVANSMNDLANAQRASGDLGAAERNYHEALRIARIVKYSEGIATYTGNLGGLALDREEWSAAEALSREALTLAENVGRVELIANDCLRLAKALLRQGKKEEALHFVRRSVEILEKLGSPDLAIALEILAECEQ